MCRCDFAILIPCRNMTAFVRVCGLIISCTVDRGKSPWSYSDTHTHKHSRCTGEHPPTMDHMISVLADKRWTTVLRHDSYTHESTGWKGIMCVYLSSAWDNEGLAENSLGVMAEQSQIAFTKSISYISDLMPQFTVLIHGFSFVFSLLLLPTAVTAHWEKWFMAFFSLYKKPIL